MGSQAGELLCLRWEDFGSHFSDSFRDLRDRDGAGAPSGSTPAKRGDPGAFYDVSLAAGAGCDHVVQAHRVVLSSCSPFFRRLLSRQAASAGPLAAFLHPVIYLRGVSAKDLDNVIDFMYRGEVNVAQDELDAFLAVAEDLKIKGLTQNAGDDPVGGDPGGGGAGGGHARPGGIKRDGGGVGGGGPPKKRPAPPGQQQNQRPRGGATASAGRAKVQKVDNEDDIQV